MYIRSVHYTGKLLFCHPPMSLTLLVLNFLVLGQSQSLLEVLDWEHISFSLNFSVYFVRLLNPDEVAGFAVTIFRINHHC